MHIDPVLSRQFALDVVAKLRAAGHQALWAGGCVRDQLLGKTPKDYDVATDAEPDRIREVFGRKRTLAIGAAFGVITVLGPKDTGPIEVATFRRDIGYSDGRRPDAVEFTSAEEDAKRRDLTINGIFYDPISEQYHDYVGGQEDLKNRIIRAIGNPHERFAEDKLRMLRTIRFAATFHFALDSATFQAVQAHASDIQTVSAERITAEMRRMLIHENRVVAVQMLRDSGLISVILPELKQFLCSEPVAWDRTLSILGELKTPSFAMSLAALLREVARHTDLATVKGILTRWKLPNEDSGGALMLLRDESIILAAPSRAWPQIQRLLIAPRADELMSYCEAVAVVLNEGLESIAFCRQKLALPDAALNPPPLITGEDLKKLGIALGPTYKDILEAVRDEQLEGRIGSLAEAVELIQARFAGQIRKK
ncbi:MAG: CCA tRNA nucleotidyltransferase [Planctomycetales bacterium]|nr:CCA tRNA nucleotidyltransferase [Planctomycetales bacterium]